MIRKQRWIFLAKIKNVELNMILPEVAFKVSVILKCDSELYGFEKNDGGFQEMWNRTKRKVSWLYIYNICMCEMSMQSWRSQMTVSSLIPAQAKGQMAPFSVGRRCANFTHPQRGNVELSHETLTHRACLGSILPYAPLKKKKTCIVHFVFIFREIGVFKTTSRLV